MVSLRVGTWHAVLSQLAGWPAGHAVSVTLHRRYWEHLTPKFFNICFVKTKSRFLEANNSKGFLLAVISIK